MTYYLQTYFNHSLPDTKYSDSIHTVRRSGRRESHTRDHHLFRSEYNNNNNNGSRDDDDYDHVNENSYLLRTPRDRPRENNESSTSHNRLNSTGGYTRDHEISSETGPTGHVSPSHESLYTRDRSQHQHNVNNGSRDDIDEHDASSNLTRESMNVYYSYHTNSGAQYEHSHDYQSTDTSDSEYHV